ncbi:calcium-activated potassium channel subunit beta-4 isoform X2 [Strix uralensis]|uniref:calcium-activated potassium channel subunit beta-4 isoform X2 n=2 Tax=Strix TaxID=36304 RepID=UPI003DA754AD
MHTHHPSPPWIPEAGREAGGAAGALADGSDRPTADASGNRAMARSRAAYEYTEAEDKSMRLGFLLIAAGLLSLLGLGCCWLRPALQERGGGGSANCTVLAVRQLGERFACTFSCGAACRGTARYPCLQVLVRTSRSSAPALLHEDERQLRTNPKCSYIPPCARDDQENSENVTYKQKYWKEKVGSQPFTCYFNQHLSKWEEEEVLLPAPFC